MPLGGSVTHVVVFQLSLVISVIKGKLNVRLKDIDDGIKKKNMYFQYYWEVRGGKVN